MNKVRLKLVLFLAALLYKVKHEYFNYRPVLGRRYDDVAQFVSTTQTAISPLPN